MTQAQPTTTRPADASPPRHLPALDGLRGVAVLGVLAFHTGLLPGGFLGVDLFFTLSGFLITGLLLREVGTTGTVALRRFWARRLRRLLPACAVVLAVVTGAVVTLESRGAASADLVRTTLVDGPWVQLNLANWHFLAEQAGYWDRFGQQRVFAHLWSIAVEEQFYLVWPLVVLAVARLSRRLPRGRPRPARPGARPDLPGLSILPGRLARAVAVTAAAVSLASLALMVALLDPADPTRVYTGTDTRAFSLLLGAAVAAPPARAGLLRAAGRWSGTAAALLVAGTAALWLLADGTASPWLFTGGLFAHSLASALLVALCAEAPRTAAARALAWRPLRWLGGISYSLYLWHWPVVVLLSPEATGLEGGPWATTVWTTTVWAVSLALAAASKYLVEDPVRFRATWARGRRGALVLGAVTLGLALLWLLPAPAPAEIDVSELG
ncbi:acyltransferase [Myceligenerans cantabricum]